MDNSNWIQISSGNGPEECRHFVGFVLRKIIKSASKYALKIETVAAQESDISGNYYSAIINISGEESQQFITAWCGNLQWVCTSPYRKNHKRKNWFIAAQAITPAKLESIDVKDLKYESFKSGGPGGQHVNKTDSGVRVTHIPSGISVTATEERSQRVNKKLALIKLLEKVENMNSDRVNNDRDKNWRNSKELERGNAKLTFKGDKFKLVKGELYEK